MKLVKIGKIAAASLCILAIMAGCTSSNSTGPDAHNPSGANSGSSSSSTSTPPEENVKVPEKKDFGLYPISDPSTWVYTKNYKYNFKILETGEIVCPSATYVSVIPSEIPEDEIYLDGVPFEMLFGARYIWDGQNLRCFYNVDPKPVKKENLTYKEGYKYICEVECFSGISTANGWVKDEKVEEILSKVGKYQSDLVALDGVLLYDDGTIKYGSYWYNENYYYRNY